MVVFSKVAWTFVFGDTFAYIEPSVGRIDVALIVDDLVHLRGHMGGVFGGKTTHDDVIIIVVSGQLSIPLVGTAAVAAVVGIIALDVLRITDQKDMAYVGIVVILALNIGLQRIAGEARSRSPYHRRGTANLLFPCHERLHRAHESVVADDEQFTSFTDGIVFAHSLVVVDEMVGIEVAKLGVHLHRVRAAVNGVFALSPVGKHLNGHVVIYAQGLGNRVVGERIDDHVLPTEVAEDVRLVKDHILGGEESVGRIGLAVGVRHRSRIDLSAEVAFRRSHFHQEISVLRLNDANVVVLVVANHHGHGNHGQVGFARFSGADGLGNRDDVGFATRCGHLEGVKARELHVYGNP